MNRSRNLVISFIMSVVLHGIAVLGVASLVMVGTAEIVPVFKQGVSSVLITIDQPAIPVVVPEPKIEKNILKPLQRKPEARSESKIEPVKAVIPLPNQQAKTFMPKREEPKPVVAVKQDEDNFKEEHGISENDMFRDVSGYEMENLTDVKKDDYGDVSMAGKKTDEGVQAFANSESFVDISPSYPLGARMRGEEGVVVVRVTVSPSGRAENVEVMKSSGYASLDGSAINAIKKARFVAKNGGVINGGQITLPFRFKLVN